MVPYEVSSSEEEKDDEDLAASFSENKVVNTSNFFGDSLLDSNEVANKKHGFLVVSGCRVPNTEFWSSNDNIEEITDKFSFNSQAKEKTMPSTSKLPMKRHNESKSLTSPSKKMRSPISIDASKLISQRQRYSRCHMCHAAKDEVLRISKCHSNVARRCLWCPNPSLSHLAASCGFDGSLFVWDLLFSGKNGQPMTKLCEGKEGIRAIRWQYGGDRIIVGGFSSVTKLLDVETGKSDTHYVQ